MKIVTDSGADLPISAQEIKDLEIHIVPLKVTLDGETYLEGVDIHPKEFYQLLASSKNLPITSQPSAGDFVEIYRKLAVDDPQILSIHISSGLSGTYNSAIAGAKLTPEANVTHVDTKTLSAVTGWQVVSAARAGRAGWSTEQILNHISEIGAASESLYTLNELKYLIHGGRISHMKGLIASLLDIKPLIGVEKLKGTYVQLGQSRTFSKAIQGLVDLISKQHKPGSKLKVQVLHAFNPESAEILRERIGETFECSWFPIGRCCVCAIRNI